MAEGTAEAGMDRRVEPEAELGEATSPAVARDLFRGGVVRPTCGISKGYAQANMIALPREYAYDFLLFAQRNPKPCPILDVLDPGSPTPSIARTQQSVNLQSVTREELAITGRHDPCIVPRAVPCVEAAVAVAVYDALLARRKETR